MRGIAPDTCGLSGVTQFSGHCMATASLVYQNPVWSGYLADPFVLRFENHYYAYGTGSDVGNGRQSDGRMFPVLRSSDLIHWTQLGGALEPISSSLTAPYWAPEVAYHNGRFFLYYAVDMRLRVAIASDPAGPFIDSGRDLFPDEPFSIDASPFKDARDGKWYLFFAKDYFDERVGTGTAVVPLADDMMTPLAPPKVVVRASSDWQIFQRNRRWYDRDWEAWHTVEGPFVMERDGQYYCLYSGGCWETADYGVSYAVAEHPLGPWRDEWSSSGPTVLKGVPEKVLGPGHNSVVRGPDGQTDYVVYHAWDSARTARRMCIDPLVFGPEGPRCEGPSTEPRELTSTLAQRSSTPPLKT
jgi:arabinan endo-1,5-alpha-L-arabinosidase